MNLVSVMARSEERAGLEAEISQENGRTAQSVVLRLLKGQSVP